MMICLEGSGRIALLPLGREKATGRMRKDCDERIGLDGLGECDDHDHHDPKQCAQTQTTTHASDISRPRAQTLCVSHFTPIALSHYLPYGLIQSKAVTIVQIQCRGSFESTCTVFVVAVCCPWQCVLTTRHCRSMSTW